MNASTSSIILVTGAYVPRKNKGQWDEGGGQPFDTSRQACVRSLFVSGDKEERTLKEGGG